MLHLFIFMLLETTTNSPQHSTIVTTIKQDHRKKDFAFFHGSEEFFL